MPIKLLYGKDSDDRVKWLRKHGWKVKIIKIPGGHLIVKKKIKTKKRLNY